MLRPGTLVGASRHGSSTIQTPLWLAIGAVVAFLIAISASFSFDVSISLMMVIAAILLTYSSVSAARIAGPAFIFVVEYVILVYVGNLVSYIQGGYGYPMPIAASLFVFALGAYATGSHWSQWTTRPPDEGSESLRATEISRARRGLICGGVAVFAAAITIYGHGIPILSRTPIAAALQARQSGPLYVSTLLTDLPILMSAVALTYACTTRSRRWYLVTGIIGVAFFLLTFGSTSRGPLLVMALSWIVIFSHFRVRLRWRQIMYGLIAASALLVGFVYTSFRKYPGAAQVQQQNGIIAAAAWFIWRRLFYIQALVVTTIFRDWPHPYPFFGGSELVRTLIPFSGGSGESLGHSLFPLLGLSSQPVIAGSTVGYAPPTTFGELYVNYGLPLSLILLALLGAAFGLIERSSRGWVTSGGPRLALYAVLATTLGNMAIIGAGSSIRTIYYVLGLYLIFFILFPRLIRHRRELEAVSGPAQGSLADVSSG